MSKKACIIFSIWTSFFSALFYHVYGMLPDLFSRLFGYDGFHACGWVMFVCLGIYFGMGLKPRDILSALLSAYAGMVWGQVDFLLGDLFGSIPGVSPAAAMFISILVGTTITMYIHLYLLDRTPLRQMPFIFAGVCLTFSQGGSNVPGLAVTMTSGIILCAVCTFMLGYATAKWPRSCQT